MTPPMESMPKNSNPQGDEQVIEQEQIVVGDVVGMMRSFQRMSKALINRLDRDEARAPTPPEVLQSAPTVTGSFHRELEKVNFPSSSVPRTVQPPRHGWRIWQCASHFVIIPPT